jgi:hypothetical protein
MSSNKSRFLERLRNREDIMKIHGRWEGATGFKADAICCARVLPRFRHGRVIDDMARY